MNVVWLETMDYDEALHLQEKTHKLRMENKIEDTLLLVEHKPVITIGKSGSVSNIYLTPDEILENNISVFTVNRGGNVTYHGPGQLVGYPIVDLKGYNKDLRAFVYRIGNIIKTFLKNEYDITSQLGEGKYTGVWVGNDKITAIGLSAKRWVTMHGFALNVCTNLSHFKWINPCGLVDKGVTSIEVLQKNKHACNDIIDKFSRVFCDGFDQKLKLLSKEEYMDLICKFS